MIQTLKLGLTGEEITLPTESRSNEQGSPTPYVNETRSANKTLHVDFIRSVESWTISYEILSKADYELIFEQYNLQFTTPSFLNFIYTDEQGSESMATVKCSITNKGSLMQRGDWYYSGVTLQLEEV